MKILTTIIVVISTLLLSIAAPITQVKAQNSAYRLIERDIAKTNRIQVQVTPGRATPVSFSDTDETITYILVADPSRIVYTTDNRATTIFLKVIKPLKFPGSTTTTITNLLVQTIDKAGQLHLYNFDIFTKSLKTEYIGIKIVGGVAGQQTLLIDENRQATVNDIETGLKIAIKRGYTNSNDPIVPKVQQLLGLLRTNKVTIPEAAKSVDVPLEVILELGKIAINQRSCKLLISGC